jgi:uncharacterized protein YecT (DUF1311 family)
MRQGVGALLLAAFPTMAGAMGCAHSPENHPEIRAEASPDASEDPGIGERAPAGLPRAPTGSPTPAVSARQATVAPLPSASQAERDEADRRADSCWKDLTCAPAEARARTRAAVLAGAAHFGCEAAYQGVGMAADWPLARACLERELGGRSCGDSSPSLERILLATMLLDGQGGPPEADRARALLGGCFQDASVGALLARVESGPSGEGKPLDFCQDLGGTTLSMNECGQVSAARLAREADVAEKELAARLDGPGRAALAGARAAWLEFGAADARLCADQARGGTMSGQLYVAHLASVSDARALAARGLLGGPPTPDADAGRALAKALATARSESDPERRALLDASQRAWVRTRASHVALARRLAPSPAAGKAVEGWLDRQRIKLLLASTQLFK